MRQTTAPSSVICFSVFEFDLAAGELRKNGRKVRVEGQPLEVLAILLERPGKAVQRDELKQKLWPGDTLVDFDHGINTAVKRLRHALDDSAETPRFIETLPRRGYRFIYPLAIRPESAVPAAQTTRYSARRLIALGVLLVAAGVVAGRLTVRPAVGTPRPDALLVQVFPPKGLAFGGAGTNPAAAVSPDGRRFAFLAASGVDREQCVWVQTFDSSRALRLKGSEGAWAPFWSADGQRVAFSSSRGLQVIEPGRASAEWWTAEASGAGAWNDRDEILVGPRNGLGPLSLLGGEGRRRRVVTALDAQRGEIGHVWPQFLPGGREFLYLALASDRAKSAVYLGSLDRSDRTLILETPFAALYASGYVLFVKGEALVAQPFDQRARRLVGQALPVAPSVDTNLGDGRVAASVSQNGMLVYWLKSPRPTRQLAWFDQTGRRLGELGAPASITGVRLSPDGTRAALQLADSSVWPHAPDIWVLDVARNTMNQLTSGAAREEDPVWAPDSGRLACARHPVLQEPSDLYLYTVGGSEPTEALLASGVSKHPTDWSRDGRFLLFERPDGGGHSDVWVLPLESLEPYPLLQGPYNQRQARFSPNGRLVAYVSDDSGNPEVYIETFGPPGDKWQISKSGGAVPAWDARGRSLFFVSRDEKLMAATIQPSGAPDADPRVLFDLQRLVPEPFTGAAYAVRPDGRGFLVAVAVGDEPGGVPLFALANWTRRVE